MSDPEYVHTEAEISPPMNEAGKISDQERKSRQSFQSLNSWMEKEKERESGLHSHQSSVIEDKTAQITREFTANAHDLAASTPRNKGAVQQGDGDGASGVVRDVGWHRSMDEIPQLIGEVENRDVFAMIRRFNKDVFAVRAIPASTGLDLNDAWEDKYQTDKLTLNLQRLYLSVVLGSSSLAKQVARLRSWKETRRTSAFCVVYTIAWFLDLLMPLLLGTLLLIISSPKARNTLFPPAPRSLVSLKTGGLETPQAGQLGTVSTLTGAPEKEPGEAMEEEAASFVDNVRHLIQRIIGMHDNPSGEGDPLEGKVPKPIRKAVKSVKAKGSAAGHTQDNEGEEQTKAPMEEMIWEKTKPEVLAPVVNAVPHVLGEVVDTWERMANAISPTPPFSRLSYLRLSAVVVPSFLASCFVSSYMVYKASGFAIGFLIFGEPALSPILEWINTRFPKWKIMILPKNNVLLGVPTNSQLTLTLLRIGETNNSPIPPVSSSSSSSSNLDPSITSSSLPLGGSTSEKLKATQPPPSSPESESGIEADRKSKSKSQNPLSKFAALFKNNTKAAIHSKLAIDKVRATMGSEKAKGYVGVMPKHSHLIFSGPGKFKARFEGNEGWLSITSSPFSCLLFTRDGFENENSGRESGRGSVGRIEISFRDIKELKRATAFDGKIAEMVGGWASDSGRELLGSLEILDVNGRAWRFTGVVERDEVFNRVVAGMGYWWENL